MSINSNVYDLDSVVSDDTIQELKDYFKNNSHKTLFANHEYQSSLISKIKLFLIKAILKW